MSTKTAIRRLSSTIAHITASVAANPAVQPPQNISRMSEYGTRIIGVSLLDAETCWAWEKC